MCRQTPCSTHSYTLCPHSQRFRSRELGFSFKPCYAQSSSVSTPHAIANAVDCYGRLAGEHVDAVYVTTHRGVTPESIEKIARILEDAKIPSFSMNGYSEVKKGNLLSLAARKSVVEGKSVSTLRSRWTPDH